MDSQIDAAQLLNQAMAQAPKSQKGRDPEKLKETAQQFEAIFIQQMYKEMRKTVPDDGLIPKGNAEDVFNQFQDMEAAKITAQRGGIGLTDMMMQQLLKNQ